MNTPAVTLRGNDDQWIDLSARIPAVTAVIGRYLDQAAVTLRPTSVVAADRALRGLAGFLIEAPGHVRSSV